MILLGLMMIINPILATTDYSEQGGATAEKYYSMHGLEVKRIFVSEPTQEMDLVRDEIVPAHRSVMTIRILNTGDEEKNDVILTEDLAYIPANAMIEFDPQPASNGRSVDWRIARLAPKDFIDVSYVIDALVSKSAILDLPAPKISYDVTKAMLIAPNSVDVGEKIELTLLDERGKMPLSDVVITVTNPQSTKIKVKTDNYGKAVFVATQKGAYRFASDDYQLIRSDTTYSVSAKEQGDTDPQTKRDEDRGSDFDALAAAGSIFALWPIAAAGLIAIAVLVLIFNFFNSPVEEEDIPAAPSTRPMVDRDDPEDQRTGTQRLTIDSSIPTEEEPEISPIREDEQPQEPMIPDIPQEEEQDLESMTQDLLAKRRELQKQDDGQEEETHIDYSEPTYKEEQTEQPSEVEPVEIDDDAIKKTIEELEQLRTELKETEKQLGTEEQIDYGDMLPEEDRETGQEDEITIPRPDEIDVESKIKEDMQKLLLPEDDVQVDQMTKKIVSKPKAKKKSVAKKAKPKAKKKVAAKKAKTKKTKPKAKKKSDTKKKKK